MSCRTDIQRAILENVNKNYVKGQPDLEFAPYNVIVVKGENSQKRAEALADKLNQNTKGHIMGSIAEFNGTHTLTLSVSPAYIEKEYQKLPKDQQTDPADIELPQKYRDILQDHMKEMDGYNQLLAESSPTEFLKFVAQQSYGIAEDGTTYDQSAPFSVAAIREAAQELFPRSTFTKPDGLPAIEHTC